MSGVRVKVRPGDLLTIEQQIGSKGLCADGTRDPEGWFPAKSSRPRDARMQRISLAEASRQCSSELFGPCPVRELCAQAAIARGEADGIWGGLPAWLFRSLRRKPSSELAAMFRLADEAAVELADAIKTSTTKNSAGRPRLAA